MSRFHKDFCRCLLKGCGLHICLSPGIQDKITAGLCYLYVEGGKAVSMLLKCVMLINAINFAHTSVSYLPCFQVTVVFCGAEFKMF